MALRRASWLLCGACAAWAGSLPAAGSGAVELTFRAGDGNPFSVFQDLTLITTRPETRGFERDPATDSTPYITGRRLFGGGACGALRDGRATICEEPAWTPAHPFAPMGRIHPGGRPWTKGGGSLESRVSGRGDLLFHTSDAREAGKRPLLRVIVKPRLRITKWKAKRGVVHPFYYTPEDIRRARANVERCGWARRMRDSCVRAAEKWASMRDEALRGLIPEPGWPRTALDAGIWDYGGLLDVCPVAHVLTGDARYARPVAVVLVRLAQGWPHWSVKSREGRGTEYATPKAKEPPYNTTAYRTTSRWAEQKLLMFAGIAYDLTYHSGEYEKLGEREYCDAKGLVETEFLGRCARFHWNRTHALGNFDGYQISALACAARAAGEPELVHAAIHLLRSMLTNNFYRDGFWFERTSGYHEQTLNLYRAPEALMDYSDPPGFVSRIDGTHLEHFDPYERFPLLARAYAATLGLLFPNLDTARFNDTSPREGWSPELYQILAFRAGRTDLPIAGREERFALFHRDPRAAVRPALVPELERSGILPASGFVTLRSGRRGTGQAALFFTYGGSSSSHRHTDPLSFVLFAWGHEFLTDIGYTHTYLRYSWPATTASHSTVLIDGRLAGVAPGDLRLYIADGGQAPSIQIVEASQERAYAHAGATEYRRLLASVRSRDDLAYVWDVFRAAGGSRHDYMLQPGPQQGQRISFEGIAPRPRRGTLAGEDTEYGHGRGSEYERRDWFHFVTDIRHAVTPGRFSCTWRLKDGTGCRATFLGCPKAEFFAGVAPAIHFGEDGELRVNYDDGDLADRVKKPVLCLRRAGGGLRSTFVALIEPFRRRPLARDVHLLNLGEAGRAAGIRIVARDEVHCLVSADGGEPVRWSSPQGFRDGSKPPAEEPGFGLRGIFGAVLRTRGMLDLLLLAGGTEITTEDGYGLRQAGAYEGTIDGIHGDLTGEGGNFIVTSASLPEGDVLAGRVLRIEHGDGTASAEIIAGVRRRDGKARIGLEPGRRFVWARCTIDRVQSDPPVLHTPDSLLKALDGSFDGKWATSGGKTYRVRRVTASGRMNVWFPGFDIELAEGERAAGIEPGDVVILHAVHPGDPFRVVNIARLVRIGDREYRLEATGATDVTIPGGGGVRTLLVRQAQGGWRRAGSLDAATSRICGRLEAGDLVGGRAMLRLE